MLADLISELTSILGVPLGPDSFLSIEATDPILDIVDDIRSDGNPWSIGDPRARGDRALGHDGESPACLQVTKPHEDSAATARTLMKSLAGPQPVILVGEWSDRCGGLRVPCNVALASLLELAPYAGDPDEYSDVAVVSEDVTLGLLVERFQDEVSATELLPVFRLKVWGRDWCRRAEQALRSTPSLR